ncbi:hypothetical protein ACO34A_26975 (plasmid) [Rhizobium sp. ACO-34A]|nr:metalloregulator ArsR/SmtB family transcription factor [Rhizobium sp. ACO-34A]ATN37414.1 hypothetical protein ACO34A_26975 [Rhizobium sp. ACO-34A]
MYSDQAHLEERLEKEAELLRYLGNPKRLLICVILSRGEWDVTSLAAEVELSSSALSQHLTRLREVGIVKVRRAAQCRYYSCDHSDTLRILRVVHEIFGLNPAPATCPPKDDRDPVTEQPAGIQDIVELSSPVVSGEI